MKNSTKNSLAFWRPKPNVPLRTIDDYTKEEQVRARQEFELILRRYEERMLRAEKWVRQFVGFGILAFITSYFFSLSPSWFWPPAVVALTPALISSYARLYCPACWNGIYHHDGTYCPQCGGIFQQRGSFVFGYHVMCTRCQVVPKHSKSGRNYTIRNCTYCGVKLHGVGI